MQNGFHSHPPRNPSPRFAQFRILWISFITFLLGNAKRICKTVLVNSVLFSCLLCVCLRDKWSWKQFKSFLVSSHPFSPLKKKKEERKRNKRKEWKELCYERKTCRLGAEELRINVGVNEKRSKKLSSADGGMYRHRNDPHHRNDPRHRNDPQSPVSYTHLTLPTIYSV